MLRLKSILMVGIVAVPFMINAADFSFWMKHRHGYWIEIEQLENDSTAWEAFNTYNSTDDECFHGGKFGANVEGDNLVAELNISLLPGASTSQLYTKWNFSDDAYFKMGYSEPDFGTKTAEPLFFRKFNSSKAGGSRGISKSSFLMEYGFKGLKIALAQNENKSGSIFMDAETSDASVVQYTKTWIPKIVLKYGLENDMIRWNVAGAFNTHTQFYGDAKDTIGEVDTISRQFNGMAFLTDFRLIVSKITFQIAVVYGINGELVGVNPYWNSYIDVYVVEDETKNYTMFGLPVSVSIALSDNASWTVGGGTCMEKEGIDSASTYSGLNIYTNFAIKPLEGLTFYPEAGFYMEKCTPEDPDNVEDTWVDKRIYFGFATSISL